MRCDKVEKARAAFGAEASPRTSASSPRAVGSIEWSRGSERVIRGNYVAESEQLMIRGHSQGADGDERGILRNCFNIDGHRVWGRWG